MRGGGVVDKSAPLILSRFSNTCNFEAFQFRGLKFALLTDSLV